MEYNTRDIATVETAKGAPNLRGLILRVLAAALGVYLALSLTQVAMGCLEEARRGRELRDALRDTGEEIAALEREDAMTEEQLLRLAFRQTGKVSPEDVVFFDAGTVRRRGGRIRRPKTKEEQIFVWSLQ